MNKKDYFVLNRIAADLFLELQKTKHVDSKLAKELDVGIML